MRGLRTTGSKVQVRNISGQSRFAIKRDVPGKMRSKIAGNCNESSRGLDRIGYGEIMGRSRIVYGFTSVWVNFMFTLATIKVIKNCIAD